MNYRAGMPKISINLQSELRYKNEMTVFEKTQMVAKGIDNWVYHGGTCDFTRKSR